VSLPLPLAAAALPAEGAAGAWTSGADPAPVAWAPSGPAPRILVAEDNVVNQHLAIRTLEKIGCRVDLATNGREAVERSRETDYTLVLMDCQMPVLDGFEATAAIRALGGPRSKVPIVAMTAAALQGDRERCLSAGMDDYLSKPIQPNALRALVSRYIVEAKSA
jgi:CheY-like chemotaxis protein